MADRKWAKPVFIISALVLLPLVAYVAGYFWLCNVMYLNGLTPTDANDPKVRGYPVRFVAEIYRPAAKVESAVISRKVLVAPEAGPLFAPPPPPPLNPE